MAYVAPIEGVPTDADLVTVDRRVIRRLLISIGAIDLDARQLKNWHKVADQIGLDLDKNGNKIVANYTRKT